VIEEIEKSEFLMKIYRRAVEEIAAIIAEENEEKPGKDNN
jgi:hypothetical protein